MDIEVSFGLTEQVLCQCKVFGVVSHKQNVKTELALSINKTVSNWSLMLCKMAIIFL